MIKDYKSGREINIKEKMLIVKDRIYSKESYIAFDTQNLKGYPPRLYYETDGKLLAKMYDDFVYELEDIEDILLSYQDYCFSNHDLDDIRQLLISKRLDFLKTIKND